MRLITIAGVWASAALLHASPLVQPTADGVRVEAGSGETIQVSFLGEHAVQITAWPKGGHEPAPSYTVDGKPGLTVAPKVRQPDANTVEVSGTSVRVSVNLRSGQVSFADVSGRTLLTEAGRTFTPATVNKENTFQVEQAFAVQPTESLFGLGQQQDGHWNLRGLPAELRQHNTHIAIPVILSTGGYGIIWDNAALTDFNPADTPVELTLTNPEPIDQGAAGPKATEDLIAAPVKKKKPAQPIRTGTFTTDAAGEYVFFVRNTDRRDQIAILVDDKSVADITNLWTPYSLGGVVTLPAKTTVKVTVRGGGPAPVLTARARETGRTVFRSAAGDAVRYTFLQGASFDALIASVRDVTGTVPMLPRWAFGFWQCRERYDTQEQLLAAARKYRELRIPVDLMVQDWQYWGSHGWGAYQWDAKKYPDPAAMIRELHDLNLKFMISVWPNPRGAAGDEFNKLPQGKVGSSAFYDPTNPAAVALRWKWLDRSFFSLGTDAWWQDAAEPGDEGAAVYGSNLFIGSGDRHANAYPFFHSKGLYESQRAASAEKRVVNLTRSAFTGQQRFGTIAWSGDVNGDWVTLRRQISAGLQFSLTGQPFWTTDAGGFFRPGKRYTSKDHNELQARWFQWSTFCPILRIHGYQTKTEFWEWLPATQAVLTDYTRLRYRMLPYNYSVAWQVTHANASMLRPLASDFPGDTTAVATSDAYLFGPSFLVTPVTTPGAVSREVYLPAGANWLNFWTGETHSGGRTITVPADLATLPLHVRAGSIVPFGPELQYAAEKPADPIELRVYPGADGAFTLYEDEGDSYRYEKGAFATIPFAWDDDGRTLTIGARAGSFPGMLGKRTFRVILVRSGVGVGTTFDSPAAVVVSYDGTAQNVVLK